MKKIYGLALAALMFAGPALAAGITIEQVPSRGALIYCQLPDGTYKVCQADSNGYIGTSAGGGDTRPSSGTITVQDTGSATTTGQNSATIISGTPTASSYQSFAVNGQSAVGVSVTGTWTGTLEFDISYDGGTTWFTSGMRVRGAPVTTSTITANGNFYGDVSSATNFRVRGSAAMTGTATVQADFSNAAGPVHILNSVSVGGFEFNATDTPTVQNAAYSASNCIGGFRTLTVSRTASGGIILNNFSIRSVTGITPTIQVYIFNANPSASTCTDKSTFTLNSADISKIPAGGVFQVTLATAQGGTPTFGAATNLAISMNANASSQIYYAMVATASMTPGSTTDLQETANGPQD